MTLNFFYETIDDIAPKKLSDEYCAAYDAYDNSGILIDAQTDVQKALFSLDFSLAAVRKAIEEKADVIVTHHPAIYAKIGKITRETETGNKIALCLKHGISVISCHLNLDMAIGGVDECLCSGVVKASGGKEDVQSVAQPLPESDGGYGRAYRVGECKLQELVEGLKKEFRSERVLFYGDPNATIKRVASFCGAGGGDEGIVDFAVQKRADAIVSSDFKHHVLVAARENGLNVICLTHYASENYGFEKFYEKIRGRIEIPCVYHTDEELL